MLPHTHTHYASSHSYTLCFLTHIHTMLPRTHTHYASSRTYYYASSTRVHCFLKLIITMLPHIHKHHAYSHAYKLSLHARQQPTFARSQATCSFKLLPPYSLTLTFLFRKLQLIVPTSPFLMRIFQCSLVCSTTLHFHVEVFI
jgi:hypothetical protein